MPLTGGTATAGGPRDTVIGCGPGHGVATRRRGDHLAGLDRLGAGSGHARPMAFNSAVASAWVAPKVVQDDLGFGPSDTMSGWR
jgi:hypothetical protein